MNHRPIYLFKNKPSLFTSAKGWYAIVGQGYTFQQVNLMTKPRAELFELVLWFVLCFRTQTTSILQRLNVYQCVDEVMGNNSLWFVLHIRCNNGVVFTLAYELVIKEDGLALLKFSCNRVFGGHTNW